MVNVLIRDVPTEDLEQIRSAAAAQGLSLQAYLLRAVHAQAAHLRRREALNRTATRLEHQRAVDEQDRQAVLEAIDDAHIDRGAQLGQAR
ncbi:antitoxin [Mycobacterium sp.]|uniref:antitoxin n=1 Tax=Mycobacterium sp. TaxID=1785 RepID=UPI0012747277|nr:antitoxin [Mycobacterium sp.]KAA8960979.1 MAG: antitoxin [Mycobacterium sp.]